MRYLVQGRRSVFLIAFFLSLLCPPILRASETFQVVFINPGTRNDTFFKPLTDFMQAAAEDLQIELEILYADRDHLKMIEHAQAVASREQKPDYLVINNEKGVGGAMLEAADKASIKTFLFNEGFYGDSLEKYGHPRQIYPYFIGELIPDEYYAGYTNARVLFEYALAANALADDNLLHILVLSGTFETYSNEMRLRGLQQAVSEFGNVKVEQIIPCYWERDYARNVTPMALQRYPKVRAIWGGTEDMALGAMDAAIAQGLTPGKDLFFSGQDWTTNGIKAVKDGTMMVALGGHFMDGGWVMVLLHDYHQGHDFINDQISTKMYALVKENIADYETYLLNQDWRKLDFTRFSKVLNPELADYNFGVDAVIEQLKTLSGN